MKEKITIIRDNSDSRGAMAALQWAAESARQIAIQTNTAIIIVRDGRRIRVTAEELRKERDSRTQ